MSRSSRVTLNEVIGNTSSCCNIDISSANLSSGIAELEVEDHDARRRHRRQVELNRDNFDSDTGLRRMTTEKGTE